MRVLFAFVCAITAALFVVFKLARYVFNAATFKSVSFGLYDGMLCNKAINAAMC